jgi:hypothetical protein
VKVFVRVKVLVMVAVGVQYEDTQGSLPV